ncbi:MAG: SWIM zinc finger domain-containing protein, partial [Opitutales bacterium]
MPDATSPASPPALAALCGWLDVMAEGTATRGRSYFKAGRVRSLHLDGEAVTAEVHGSRLYTTSLHWEHGRWSSECSCPMETDCKHAYAAGLAWVRKFDRNSAVLPPRGSPLPTIPGVSTGTALFGSHLLPPSRKPAFREQWAPVLAQKLGRPLTGDEVHQLGQLSAVYHDFKGHYERLFAYTLVQHGFPASPGAVDASGIAYADWIDRDHPPADPWALWQYIALDWERAGRTLPEAFRPQTDTAALARRLAERLAAREIETWRRALDPEPIRPPGAYQSARVRTELPADLRLRLDPAGDFLLEVRAVAGKPWKFPAAKWLDGLGRCGPADFASLPAPAAALANALAAECRGLPPCSTPAPRCRKACSPGCWPTPQRTAPSSFLTGR